MWVRIRSTDGPNFSIPVPLFLAGSRICLKIMAKCGGAEAAKYAPAAHEMIRELKRYVRENGHFTLVEVECIDGTSVKITV